MTPPKVLFDPSGQSEFAECNDYSSLNESANIDDGINFDGSDSVNMGYMDGMLVTFLAILAVGMALVLPLVGRQHNSHPNAEPADGELERLPTKNMVLLQ